MPRAPKPCGINGCRTIVPNGQRCPEHQNNWKRSPRTASSQATSGPNSSAWQKLRNEILDAAGRRCQIGTPNICTGVATVVDKDIPAARRPDMAHTRSNLQAACKECNDHKARTKDRK